MSGSVSDGGSEEVWNWILSWKNASGIACKNRFIVLTPDS